MVAGVPLEVAVLPCEGEPAVCGEHLVPLVHVNDLSQGQPEHHGQGVVVEEGRSGEREESVSCIVWTGCGLDKGPFNSPLLLNGLVH